MFNVAKHIREILTTLFMIVGIVFLLNWTVGQLTKLLSTSSSPPPTETSE